MARRMPPTTTQWSQDTAPHADSRIKLERLDGARGGRVQPALVQAAAEHLMQLGQLARYMSEADGAALRAHFPQATHEWLQGLAATVTQHQRLSGPLLAGAAAHGDVVYRAAGTTPRSSKKESRLRLPALDEVSAVPRQLGEMLGEFGPSTGRDGELDTAMPPQPLSERWRDGDGALEVQRQPQPPAQPRVKHARFGFGFGDAASPRPSAASLVPKLSAGAERVGLYVADMVPHEGMVPRYASGAPATLPPPRVGGPPPPIGELATLPACATLQSVPLNVVIEGREQVVRELLALLNTVNRVRGASNRLTPDVAAAYRPKLAYIANAYRVATTAVVERVEHWRKHDAPQQPQLTNVSSQVYPAKKSLRRVGAPFIWGGRDLLLAISRDELSFAPLPVATDPLLLTWFSEHRHWWASEEAVPEALLQPSRQHSLLELSRMQHAHEVLLFEQEAHNLPPFGPPYVGRDNPYGTALELLLYGGTGKYP